jgi:hypothetical protein
MNSLRKKENTMSIQLLPSESSYQIRSSWLRSNQHGIARSTKRSGVTTDMLAAMSRRRLMQLFAATAGTGLLAACGGGGDGGGTSNGDQPFFGGPAGSFKATPSTTSATVLSPITITTDTPTVPYDYVALGYEWEDGTQIIDFPMEIEPGVIRAVLPAGLPTSNGRSLALPVRMAVARIRNDVAEVSNVINMELQPRPFTNIPADILLGGLLEIVGRYRLSIFQRAYSSNPGAREFLQLQAVTNQLYALEARSFIGTLPQDQEFELRQFLRGVYENLGIRPEDFIVFQPRIGTASFPSTASPEQRAKALAVDVIEMFAIDLDGMSQRLADRARDISGTLITIAGITGVASATVFAGTAAAPLLASAAVAATVVGIGVGLVDGFILDNAGVIGGLPGADRLRLKGTIKFWADSILNDVLPIRTNFLPSVYNSRGESLGSRLSGFFFEVTSNEVSSRVSSALINAADSATNFIASNSLNGISFGLSSAWSQWSQSGYLTSAYPVSSYSGIYTSPFPAPSPPPSQSPAPAPIPCVLRRSDQGGGFYCALR